MKHSDMKGGWFVGSFSPAILHTTEFEVGIKYYRAGEHELTHVHKIASEITMIVEGKVTMNGMELAKGDIILLEPGEPTNFCVLEDTITAIVKTPSNPSDKYFIEYA